MRCSKCYMETDDGKFCSYCGALLKEDESSLKENNELNREEGSVSLPTKPGKSKKKKYKVKIIIGVLVAVFTIELGALLGYLIATDKIPWFSSDREKQKMDVEMKRPENAEITIIENNGGAVLDDEFETEYDEETDV